MSEGSNKSEEETKFFCVWSIEYLEYRGKQ